MIRWNVDLARGRLTLHEIGCRGSVSNLPIPCVEVHIASLAVVRFRGLKF